MSALETSIATLVFTAQYINTGILVLIYNMKPDGIGTFFPKVYLPLNPLYRTSVDLTSRMHLPESVVFQSLVRAERELGIKILTGTFADTNFQWYALVGAKIFSQCISQSIVPNVTMLTKWPVEVLKQNLLKNHQLTQKKLNKLYEGSEYPLSKRYANMLNIM